MSDNAQLHAEVLVLGGGPGGYTAAFRAADLGKKVTLVERFPTLGGVCLNVGCIPSKALLHTAQIIHEAEEIGSAGVTFAHPEIDLGKVRDHKNRVVKTLTMGLASIAKQRDVSVVEGTAEFLDSSTVTVKRSDGGTTSIRFDDCIIAVGSQPVKIPTFPNDDPRLIDSTGALELQDVPKRMLIIGGGIIGLEMATVYHALGASITVVELMDQLIPGCDADLVKPLHQRIKKWYDNIYLKTKVTGIEPTTEGLKVLFEGEEAPAHEVFDRVLVAVGRRPNGHLIGADKAGMRSMNADLSRLIKPREPMFPISMPLEMLSVTRCLRTKQPMRAKLRPRLLLDTSLPFRRSLFPQWHIRIQNSLGWV